MMAWVLVIVLLGQSPIEAYMASADACKSAEHVILSDLHASDKVEVLSVNCFLTGVNFSGK